MTESVQTGRGPADIDIKSANEDHLWLQRQMVHVGNKGEVHQGTLAQFFTLEVAVTVDDSTDWQAFLLHSLHW